MRRAETGESDRFSAQVGDAGYVLKRDDPVATLGKTLQEDGLAMLTSTRQYRGLTRPPVHGVPHDIDVPRNKCGELGLRSFQELEIDLDPVPALVDRTNLATGKPQVGGDTGDVGGPCIDADNQLAPKSPAPDGRFRNSEDAFVSRPAGAKDGAEVLGAQTGG